MSNLVATTMIPMQNLAAVNPLSITSMPGTVESWTGSHLAAQPGLVLPSMVEALASQEPKVIGPVVQKPTAFRSAATAGLMALGLSGCQNSSVTDSTGTDSFVATSGTNARLQGALDSSVVPSDITAAAYQDGIHGVSAGWRLGGVDQPTAFSSLTGTISNPEAAYQAIVSTLGVEDDIPAVVKDVIVPSMGVGIVALACYMIQRPTAYGKNAAIPGASTPALNRAKWMAFWVGMYGAFNLIETSAPEVMRNGLSLDSIQGNFPYFVAKFGVWGLLSDVWGMIAFLPFVLSTPFFARVAMRGYAEDKPFIKSGASFVDATGENAKKMWKPKSTLSFSATAEHLSDAKTKAAIEALPKEIEAEQSFGFDLSTAKSMLPAFAALNKKQGLTVSITRKRNEDVIDTQILSGTINPHSKLQASSELELLEKEGVVFRSKKDPNVFIVQKSFEVKEGQSFHAIHAYDTKVKVMELDAVGDWKSSKVSDKFTFKVSGVANKILKLVSEEVSNRSTLMFGLPVPIPTMVRRAWRRYLEGTSTTVKLKSDPSFEMTSEDYANVAVVAGPKQGATRTSKASTLHINRSVLEFLERDEKSTLEKNAKLAPENRAKVAPVTIRTSADVIEIIKEHVAPSNILIEGNEVTIASPSALLELYNKKVDLVQQSIENRKTVIVLPNELQAISTSFKLSKIEDMGVKEPAGSDRTLHDIEFAEDYEFAKTGIAAGAQEFLDITKRSLWQGVAEGGRARSLAAFTFVGATFFSVPVNIVMNALMGYVDPATWVKDSWKSYFTRGLNMVMSPAIVARIGIENYSAYAYYLSGMLFMTVLWTPAIVISAGEPDAMMAKNQQVYLSGEDRVEVREGLMEEFAYRSSVLQDGKRGSNLEFSLAQFIPAVPYRDNDMEKINGMYDSRASDATAQARMLAGLMHDKGLSYLAQQDSERFSFYQKEIQKHHSLIEAVLQEAEIGNEKLGAEWAFND